MFDVYLSAQALEAAEEHFRQASWDGKEAMGLLVGRAFTHGGRPYAVVDEYVTADNDATAVHVRFAREAFSELSKKLDGGRIVVGWIHSHPDYGCFLSTTDVATQEAFFCEPYHFAMVVDPVRRQKQCFKVRASQYVPVSFAVIRKKT
ncbi:Mov34/MPN/PAD-1 family protein [Candidatus Micrarchaeota archaeon]|nr:Mov34/MPN/PAD-1 family protein [Candidatus Micrarchaeota archaeon]